MISHATFMTTLVQLIEFAEKHALESEALSLAETAEAIAPKIGHCPEMRELSAVSSGKVVLFPKAWQQPH